MWKVVMVLCLFSGNGELLEHAYTTGVADCLEKKRIMKRNMGPTVMITCGEAEAELEEIQGRIFIKSIRKMDHN